MKNLLSLTALLLVLCCLPLCVYAEENASGDENYTQVALYPGRVTRRYKNSYTNVYSSMDKESEKIDSLEPGHSLEILDIYPYWVKVRYGKKEGYIIRNRVDIYDPYDMVNTPRFGTQKYEFYAEITQDTPVFAEKSEDSKQLAMMTNGARVAFSALKTAGALWYSSTSTAM
ncbi:MAG: hypothetical protein CW338_12325 [Clostridiales bacterium]|nr:hypothetical protein [Clostridiales bacterium]